MISIDDILGFCDLTREEVDAIAEHEHIPEVAAAALSIYLMDTPDGPSEVSKMLRDDIRHAIERGDRDHARELIMAFRHFVTEHPEALARHG